MKAHGFVGEMHPEVGESDPAAQLEPPCEGTLVHDTLWRIVNMPKLQKIESFTNKGYENSSKSAFVLESRYLY